MRVRGWTPLLVGLFALSACTGGEKGPDAAGVPKAGPADRDAGPLVGLDARSGTDKPVPPPSFASQVPALRKQVREASLQPWVKVDEDIPFYRIEATFDADFLTYTGKQDLWFKNRSGKPWDKLVFHLYPNFPAIAGDLKHIKVTSATVDGYPIEGKPSAMPSPTRFELPLETPLAPGSAATVTLEFSGLVKRYPPAAPGPLGDLFETVAELLSGGGGDWGLFAYSSGILSMSLWYPMLAVYDDEGWDMAQPSEIGDFAYFDVADHLVQIRLGDGYSLITTGSELSHDGDTWKFAAGAAREFTVSASRLLRTIEGTTGTRGPVTVRSHALDAEQDTQRRVLEAAVGSVAAYEALFGPYPYKELDVVRTDLRGGVGGVEFPGLVTIAGMLYLDELADDLGDMRRTLESRFMTETVEFVVAHEVAHQWWNAVVGSHCRNHPFVDEALANYSSILYFEKRRGAEAAQRQTLFELKLPYQLHRFFGGPDMPVDQPTSAFTDLIGYSAIVYGKGGMFLKAVRDVMGLDAFSAALTSYYAQNLFATASPEKLVATLESATPKGKQVRDLSIRWLAGTYADEDIGTLQVGELIPVLLKELDVELDGWLLETLSEPGFWELLKLADNLVTGKDDLFDGVDYDKVTAWLEKLARKLLFGLLLG
ncbi:MAG: M1 family metallopeptidase [Deltaproteobacteria bacterium]|nr:M1 family metallopeptidase [Deltaproteobacteria bacterium]